MLKKLLLNFIFGGLLFSGIYYTANIIEDQKLSSIIALIPIALICGLIINGRKNTTIYYLNTLYVLVITFILLFLTYILFKHTKISKYILVPTVLIIWIICQYLRYSY